jgi:hypothetical protein
MNRIKIVNLLFVLVVLVLLAACAGQQETLPPPPVDSTAVEEDQRVTVQVAIENLRETPNGTKVGETTSGSEYVFIERRGNWVQLKDPVRDGVWIWAPSVGFPKVNPLAMSLWVGGDQPQTVDSLTEIIGAPIQVEAYGGGLYQYHYVNMVAGREGTLFGTSTFRAIEILVDRETREVLFVGIELPPYQGSAKDLLRVIGLPEVRSTSTNFEHALYTDKFAGISTVEFLFEKSDFNKIGQISALRYSVVEYETALTAGEKKIVHEGNQLILSMEVTNTSGDFAFAGPEVAVELVEGDRNLGAWVLGPINARIEPGETEILFEPIPLSDAGIDVNRVGARAEIVSAITVRAGVVSQP